MSFLRRMIHAVLAILFAAALGYVAIPKAIEAILAYAGEETQERLFRGREVQVEDLEKLIRVQERALTWVESGRRRTYIARAHLMLAERLRQDGKDDSEQLSEAIRYFRSGLARAPARPQDWAGLARAEQLAQGPSVKAAAALEMSLLTGPYQSRLYYDRLALAFSNRQFLTERGRALVFSQIRYLWDKEPDRLVNVAIEKQGLDIIRAALRDSLADLTEFERRVQRKG